MAQGAYVTIDIGKTLSKVSLWSAQAHLLDRQTRANVPCVLEGIQRLDAGGIADWLTAALSKYRHEPLQAIVPVAHGAGVAVLVDGQLAFPPLDYEQALPADVSADYRRLRDAFAVTGSPDLPGGLNLGSQIHWLEQLHPAAMRDGLLLPWAQYWAWFLSGTAVSEVTSLGCHSDLWSPAESDFSPMARKSGLAAKFAPLAKAGDAIGTLRPDLAARTGLSPTIRIHAGLHDSNAGLLAARCFPEIAGQEATVLSTGTWFIAMRSPQIGATSDALPEGRDCLVNIDAFGQPVPSARFMGGREIELLGERIDRPGIQGLPDALYADAMVLPSQVPGTGPFPQAIGRWINQPADPDARAAAIALYAALMTDTALSLIGAKGRLLIEGRFAASEIFTRALATLRQETQVFAASAEADASFGALRLLLPEAAPQGVLTTAEPLGYNLAAYRDEWLDDLAVFA